MNMPFNQGFILLAIISLFLPLSSSDYINASIISDRHYTASSLHEAKQVPDKHLTQPVLWQAQDNNSAICQPVGSQVSSLQARSCGHLFVDTPTTEGAREPKSAVKIKNTFFPATALKPVFEIKSLVNDLPDKGAASGEAGKMPAWSDLQQANSGVWRVINLHTQECLTRPSNKAKEQAEAGQDECRFERLGQTPRSQHL